MLKTRWSFEEAYDLADRNEAYDLADRNEYFLDQDDEHLIKPDDRLPSSPRDTFLENGTDKVLSGKRHGPKRGWYFWVLLAALYHAEFVRQIDATVLPILSPTIATEFSASDSSILLAGSVFLLAETLTTPLFAAIADVTGRKPVMIFSLLLFAAASIICATSRNITVLIIGRTIQGIGAGGIETAATLLLTDLVELSERGMYYGLNQLAGAVGLLSGGIIAAGITSRMDWHWVFWINLPLILPALVVFTFVHREGRTTMRGSLTDKLTTIDWLGLTLLLGSLAGLFFAAFSTKLDAKAIVALVIGVIGLMLFCLWEEMVDKRFEHIHAVLSRRYFGSLSAAIGFALTLMQGIQLATVQNYFVLYLFLSMQLGLQRVAVIILPSTITVLFAAAGTGFLTSRIKRFQFLMPMGLGFLLAGFMALFTLRENSSEGEIIGFQIITGLGAGFLIPGRVLAIHANQRKESDVPMAAATSQLLFNLGLCFGIPVGRAILEKAWNILVKRALAHAELMEQDAIEGHLVEQSLRLIISMSPSMVELYRHIMAVAASRIWLVMAIMSGVGFCISFLVEDKVLVDAEGSSD